MAIEYTIDSVTKLDENSILEVLSKMGVTGVFQKTSSIAKDFLTKNPIGLYISIVDPHHGEWEYLENGIENVFESNMFISIRLDKQMDYLPIRNSLIQFIMGIVNISEDILVLSVSSDIILKLEDGKLKLSNTDFWNEETCQFITREYEKADFRS